MDTAALSAPIQLNDSVGTLAQRITERWLLGLRQSNPAILDVFHDRDLLPYRDLLPWSGEFAGKYITGAFYIYRLTQHKELYEEIQDFLKELLTCIDTDGYCGVYQKKCRMTGAYSQSPRNIGATWDAWSHYHIMYGLWVWYGETKQPELLEGLERIAGFFLEHFYRDTHRLIDMGSAEMNLAPYHMFALLYRLTGKEQYLRFAHCVEEDLASPRAGNYLNNALNHIPYYRTTMPRWESLHTILGFGEMYRSTGEEAYKEALLQICYSIQETDVHNTGAFSTEEKAIGTPFHNGVIELCCAIAYNALACEALRLSGDSSIADHLELSLYNAIMGSFSTSGRWSTYNTPMDGVKRANYDSIHFQSRPGSPDLNCCSANSARGIGMLSEWAVMEENEITYLNYYGAFRCTTAKGLEIRVEGDYPASGRVRIYLKSKNTQTIALRIPAWSKKTSLHLEGTEYSPEAGAYWQFTKQWDGQMLELHLDFTPRYLEGAAEFRDKRSVYCGPILYGYDLHLGKQPYNRLPLLTEDLISRAISKKSNDGRLLLQINDELNLCDFFHLGQSGAEYHTWLRFKKGK